MKDTKKAYLSSDSGSSSAITSSSKAPPLLATTFCTAFAAMLLLAFSRSELRYSCDISSSLSSSELSSPSDSESDSSEDECSDGDGPEDEDDAEGEGEMSPRSTESEGSNLPFPFSWAESVILENIYPDSQQQLFLANRRRLRPENRLTASRSVPVMVSYPYPSSPTITLVRLALCWGSRGREHTIRNKPLPPPPTQ